MAKAIKETNLINKFTEHDLRGKASSGLDTDFDAQKLLSDSSAAQTEKHYRRKGKVVDSTQGFRFGRQKRLVAGLINHGFERCRFTGTISVYSVLIIKSSRTNVGMTRASFYLILRLKWSWRSLIIVSLQLFCSSSPRVSVNLSATSPIQH